jgi:hypothetical protein
MSFSSDEGQLHRYTAFLARVPGISHAEFSQYWHDHAALAGPYLLCTLASFFPADHRHFLLNGVHRLICFVVHGIINYTQTHLLQPDHNLVFLPPYITTAYSGMVDLTFTPSCTLFNPSSLSKYAEAQIQAAQRYFMEVILPDEQRFWDRSRKSDTFEDVKERGADGGVAGVERKVIINGKIVIDLSEEVRKRWEGYGTGLVV